MLNVNNVSVIFNGKAIFENVSFQIQPKDRIGLIGKNGAGKTTLLKIIAELNKPDTGSIDYPQGYKLGILTQDLDIDTSITVRAMAKLAFKEVIEVNQRLDKLNNDLTTREDYESSSYEDLLNKINDLYEKLNLLGGNNIEGDIEKVLKGLGFLQTDFDRPLSEFSGGWQMRAEMAKILLAKPDLLILDEPTNHLDIESILWLENYFKNYAGAILMVAHDRTFLDNTTNRTIELAFGRSIDYKLPYSKFMVQRADIHEKQMATFKNQQKQIEEQEKFIERFKAKASKAKQAQSKLKQLNKVERIQVDEFDHTQMNIKFPTAPRSGDVTLNGEYLKKSYDDHCVFSNGKVYIERGEKIAFVGKNGMGKSTLVKMIMDEIPYEGALKIGHNVSIGYFAQQHDELNSEKTVFDTIYDEATDEWTNVAKVRGLLGAFLFSDEAVEKKVKVLSGGERARLALAKLLLRPYNLIILDEPTNHLDIHAQELLKNALKEFNGTLIVVSHDRDFLQDLTSKTYEFKDGSIYEHLGSIREFLDKYKLDQFRSLEEKQIKPQAKPAKTEEVKVDYSNVDRRQLKKDINRLEKSVETLESKIEELKTSMMDPDFYKHPEMNEIVQKDKDLNAQLEQDMMEWDEKTALLEKVDQ